MCVYATNEMANTRVRCMVTYKINRQTKKRSVSFKKEKKRAHTHIHTVFITQIMNEAVSSGQQQRKEGIITTEAHGHTLQTEQNRAKQCKAKHTNH